MLSVFKNHEREREKERGRGRRKKEKERAGMSVLCKHAWYIWYMYLLNPWNWYENKTGELSEIFQTVFDHGRFWMWSRYWLTSTGLCFLLKFERQTPLTLDLVQGERCCGSVSSDYNLAFYNFLARQSSSSFCNGTFEFPSVCVALLKWLPESVAWVKKWAIALGFANWTISALEEIFISNNSRTKNSRDLTIAEVVYIFIMYHIPYSWLYLLNGYNFRFDYMTGENQ